MFPVTSIQGIDYDLYENFGLLLSLLAYDSITKEKNFNYIIDKLYLQAFRRLKIDLTNDMATISVFSGIGSVIYIYQASFINKLMILNI